MNNNRYLIALVSLLLMMAACGEKKEVKDVKKQTPAKGVVGDSTIYGKCVDAAMHSLTMLTDKGDTLYFSLEDFSHERRADVQGGLLIDDKLAVIAELHDDLHFPSKVINLTTLQGEWKGAGRDFDIEEGGTVSTHVQYESTPYTTWKIFNGRLVLAPDTFDVTMLTGDSLCLENDKGIYEYRRVK